MARRASDAERKIIKTRVKTNIIDEGLNVFFHPMFYTRREAYDILQKLEAEIVYDSPEDSSVIINGERQNIRRQHVAHGDEGLVYTFCERTMDTRSWTPILAKVRDDVEKALGLRFNFCLVNRYKDGLDRIGAHRDDEEDLDPEASIVGMSFGTPRDFLFRHHTLQHPNKPATKKPKFGLYKVTLPSGSLIQMKPPTNSFWFHELPAKATAGKNPRVSLTFRMMKKRRADFVEEKRNEDYITNILERQSRSAGRSTDQSGRSSTWSTLKPEAQRVQSPWKQQKGITYRDKNPPSRIQNISAKTDMPSQFSRPAPVSAEAFAKPPRFSRFPRSEGNRSGYSRPMRKSVTSKRRSSPFEQRFEKPPYQE